MKPPRRPLHRIATLLLACAALCGTAAQAQATIDQNKVLAGNVTPGDSPGFPLTLSQPGSYKLTSNLYVPAVSSGVVITAANVTLDLNGFTIQGPNVCTRNDLTRVVICQFVNDTFGVVASTGSKVHSGTVKGFGNAAVVVYGRAARIEDLRVTESTAGLKANSAEGVQVLRVVADTNTYSGIAVDSGLIAQSSAVNNGGAGFSGYAQTLLSESQATGNIVGANGLTLRGVVLGGNGTNRVNTRSLGGNLDELTTF